MQKLLVYVFNLKEYEGRLYLKRAVEMQRDPQAAYDLAMLHMKYRRMRKPNHTAADIEDAPRLYKAKDR